MITFDDSNFFKEMNNAINYAIGFLEGAKEAKPIMMHNVSYKIKEALYDFIDSNARIDPQKLHHVYEWYETGSPNARLYDLQCQTTSSGISFSYNFTQSRSAQNGAQTPFYDKARIMEQGIGVTIKPVKAKMLVFDVDGQTVFTRQPVHVSDPGGQQVQGGFEDTIKTFFDSYLSQTLLDITGLRDELSNPKTFKDNFSMADTGGKSLGYKLGYNWIAGAGAY